MTLIRSLLFVVWMYGLIVVMGILGIWLLLCPRSWVRAYYRLWLSLVFGGLKLICGLRYKVEGLENIPEGGALMEAGTPQAVKLEDLHVPGQLSGRKHILSIMVENKPGVLARVAGLFSRRGFNIDTLAVGPTDDPSISRITLTLDDRLILLR